MDPRYKWIEVWPGTYQLVENDWYTTMKRRVEKHKEALRAGKLRRGRIPQYSGLP